MLSSKVVKMVQISEYTYYVQAYVYCVSVWFILYNVLSASQKMNDFNLHQRVLSLVFYGYLSNPPHPAIKTA